MCSRSRRRLTYCSSDSPRAPGPGAGERVGGLDDDRLDRLRLDLVVMGLHRVRDGLGLAVAPGEVAADEGVRTLDLVRHGLADVVQERGAARRLGRGAELVGHHRGQMGALDRVREDVLPVGRAVLQPAEHRDQVGVERLDVRVEARLLAALGDVRLQLGLRLVVGLLDPRGMDAAVLQQLLERHARDLAPHAVEAGEDDRVRRVVDDEVDAGQVLERADVAALAADDPALHVVGGELDDADRGLGGVAGGQPLHDDGEDVAHPPVGVALGLLLDLADDLRPVVARLVLQLLEELVARLGGRHARDALELADVVLARGLELAVLLGEHALALAQLGEAALDRLLAGAQALLEPQQVGAALGGLAVLRRRAAGRRRRRLGDRRGRLGRRRPRRGCDAMRSPAPAARAATPQPRGRRPPRPQLSGSPSRLLPDRVGIDDPARALVISIW